MACLQFVHFEKIDMNPIIMPNQMPNLEGFNDHSMNMLTNEDTNAPDPKINAAAPNHYPLRILNTISQSILIFLTKLLLSIVDLEALPEGSLYSEICDVYNELRMPVRAFHRPLFQISGNLAESDTPEPGLDTGQTVRI